MKEKVSKSNESSSSLVFFSLHSFKTPRSPLGFKTCCNFLPICFKSRSYEHVSLKKLKKKRKLSLTIVTETGSSKVSSPVYENVLVGSL